MKDDSTEDANQPVAGYALWEFNEILVLSGGCVFLSIICGQMLYYLYSGEWYPFSLIDLMAVFDKKNEWYSNPATWVGVHSILDGTPAGLGIMFLSWCLTPFLD